MINGLTFTKLESSVRHNWMADLLVFSGVFTAGTVSLESVNAEA